MFFNPELAGFFVATVGGTHFQAAQGQSTPEEGKDACAKARKKKSRLRPLEAREEDIAKDDDWAARLYIHEPRNGRSPTFKSLWNTLRGSYGMEESLD